MNLVHLMSGTVPRLKSAGLAVVAFFLAVAAVAGEAKPGKPASALSVWVTGKSATMPLDEWERLGLDMRLKDGGSPLKPDTQITDPPPVEVLGIWGSSRMKIIKDILKKRKKGSWHTMPRITVPVGGKGLLLIVSDFEYPKACVEPRIQESVNAVPMQDVLNRHPVLSSRGAPTEPFPEVVDAIDTHVRQIISDPNRPNAKPIIEVGFSRHDFGRDTKNGVSRDVDERINKAPPPATSVRLRDDQMVVLRGLKTEMVQGQPTKWRQDPNKAVIVFLTARLASSD